MFQVLTVILLFSYHYAHDTGGSIYPFLIFVILFCLLRVFLLLFLGFFTNYIFLFVFVYFINFFLWGKDAMLEGLSGFHGSFVQFGLKLRFIFFLFTEVIFFFSIFWTYFDTALSPSLEGGSVWPTFGLFSPDFMGFPLLNTLLLISRGVTITWSHSCLLTNKNGFVGLYFTILLAVFFLFVQFYEYFSLSFTLGDSVYGSVFFFSTGFHGFHVLVGTLFLIYSGFWLFFGAYSVLSHLSYECAILYWHFVDVVWLFLYLFVYWWGA